MMSVLNAKLCFGCIAIVYQVCSMSEAFGPFVAQ